MHIIRTWEALADWLRTCPDPDLTKLLRSRRDQLMEVGLLEDVGVFVICLLYTSPSPRDRQKSRMPSSA